MKLLPRGILCKILSLDPLVKELFTVIKYPVYQWRVTRSIKSRVYNSRTLL